MKDTYSEVVWWTCLQQLIKDADFWMTAEAEAWEECELSERCIRVFSQLSHVLDVIISIMAADLGHAVPALKKMRPQYANYPEDDADVSEQWTVLDATLKKDAKPRAAYLHCLTTLLFDPEARSLHRAWHIAKAFQTAIEQDADGEQYLSPWLVDKVSKMSLLAELKRQLYTAQPQTTMWRHSDQTEFKGNVSWALTDPLDTMDRVIWERADDSGFELDETAFHNLGSDSSDAAQILQAACARQDAFFKPLWVMLGHTGDKRIPGDPDTVPLRKPTNAIKKGTHEGIQDTDLEGAFERICEHLSWWLGDRAYDFQIPTSTTSVTTTEPEPLSPAHEENFTTPESVDRASDVQTTDRSDSILRNTPTQGPVPLPIIQRPYLHSNHRRRATPLHPRHRKEAQAARCRARDPLQHQLPTKTSWQNPFALQQYHTKGLSL